MTELDRESLARICAAEDPRQEWDGDDPCPAVHHRIMVAAILQDIERQGFQITRREHD